MQLLSPDLPPLLLSSFPPKPHRAFYEAGAAWRVAGRASMAFVLLNRYLDIADAVDEAADGGGGSGSGPLEAADFVGTDIPRDAPLPARHYADERLREEVGARLGLGGRARGTGDWAAAHSYAGTSNLPNTPAAPV
jgi:hypothetical protein